MKKWYVVGTIFILIFGSFLHFVYEWLQYDIIGIFGAVNESIWEHLKLLFWPALSFSIVEYTYIGHQYENYITAKAISFYLGLFLIISLFYTYTGIVGNNYLVVDILIFILSVFISQYVGYKITISNRSFNQIINFISLLGIVLIIFAFVIFTFNPPHIPLFQDPTTGKYGI